MSDRGRSAGGSFRGGLFVSDLIIFNNNFLIIQVIIIQILPDK